MIEIVYALTLQVSQRPYHLPVEWEGGTREEGGGRVDGESQEGRRRKTRKEEGTKAEERRMKGESSGLAYN